ncbi:MAG: hypothetical protein ACI81V_000848 [Lentimonas sp.]
MAGDGGYLEMDKYQVESAVLLLGFNRPDQIERVLAVVRQVRPQRLYFACDGPRAHSYDSDLELIQRVQQVVLAQVNWACEFKTLLRDSNLGCGRAVSEGITWFFEHEAEGIILEDDCLPCLSFFRYCDAMLQHYRDHSQVAHVGGCNPLAQQGRSDQHFFSQYNRIWGWATWRRAWANYDFEVRAWPRLKEEGFLDRIFPRNVARYYTGIFDICHAGEIDTWDYQWFLCRLQCGLAVIPAVNLVTNIGFGEAGTNTRFRFHRFGAMQTGRFELAECWVEIPIELNAVHDRKWGEYVVAGATKFGKVKHCLEDVFSFFRRSLGWRQ